MQLGGGGGAGAEGADRQKERKIDRKKEIADNKNPEQLPGRDQLVPYNLAATIF